METPATPSKKHDRKNVKFPPERLLDNRGMLESQFLSVDAIKEKMKPYINEGGQITLIERRTLGDVEKETNGGRFHEVSPYRQVYKVVVEYPRYYHLMLGWVENAKVTNALDAETGEGVLTTIQGKWDSEIAHPSKVFGP